jgi:arylsulfatase A-like enzyme
MVDMIDFYFDEDLPQEAAEEFGSWRQALNRMHDVYKSQIAHVDHLVSTWIGDNSDRLKDSLVIILGDHGQLFGTEGMVNHHTSLHPHGIAVPVAISLPSEWNTSTKMDGPLSFVGLANSLMDIMCGSISTTAEFLENWRSYPVISYADGPTWRNQMLHDRYGKSHPKMRGLEVRKIGVISDNIQTVYRSYWDSNNIDIETYKINPDDREKTDSPPVEITNSRKAWLRNGGEKSVPTEVSNRLKMLGYK